MRIYVLNPWAYFLCRKRAKKAENSAISKIGHYLVHLEEWVQTSSWRESKAITTAMWDTKICNKTTGIPSLPIIESPGTAMHLQWLLALTISSLWKTAIDTSCLPLQELMQPGELSLSGEQISARLTLYICPIGYIHANTRSLFYLSKQTEGAKSKTKPTKKLKSILLLHICTTNLVTHSVTKLMVSIGSKHTRTSDPRQQQLFCLA